MELSFKKIIALGIFVLSSQSVLAVGTDVTESGVIADDTDKISTDYDQNDVDELIRDEEIKLLRGSYISPYNNLQDPITLNMGYSQKADESGAIYRGGLSGIINLNSPAQGQNRAYNTDIFQLWGQTDRYAGFAFGAAGTAMVNTNQVGQPNTFAETSVFSLGQAYVDYQYSNKLDITAGNILIVTPWVNASSSNNPGGNYAMGNNTFQGGVFNVQALPSLLVTGFTAWSYLQYPNSWFTQQTYYNTMSGPLSGIGEASTGGTSGVGVVWNPVDSYSGQAWLYNFTDYANMAYVDNSYHVQMNKVFSWDFAAQGFMERSSGLTLTNQTSLPGQTTPAGDVSSNGVGGKIALNIANNTSSISYNNIFGANGSYLNGGMVTPYTYGMEADPLYTTPALTSLAELGSGQAYTIRNSTRFLDNSLKFNLSFSQFFVDQIYTGQASEVTEYDATVLYQVPQTKLNIWTRVVYVAQANSSGGNMWQPRLIVNWTF